MPDRLDAGVFAMAAAITGGEVNLVGASLEHLGVVALTSWSRWAWSSHDHGAVLHVRRDRPLRPINVITDTYPGFATDLQSPIMALSLPGRRHRATSTSASSTAGSRWPAS